jgi:hypothetical protein
MGFEGGDKKNIGWTVFVALQYWDLLGIILVNM